MPSDVENSINGLCSTVIPSLIFLCDLLQSVAKLTKRVFTGWKTIWFHQGRQTVPSDLQRQCMPRIGEKMTATGQISPGIEPAELPGLYSRATQNAWVSLRSVEINRRPPKRQKPVFLFAAVSVCHKCDCETESLQSSRWHGDAESGLTKEQGKACMIRLGVFGFRKGNGNPLLTSDNSWMEEHTVGYSPWAVGHTGWLPHFNWKGQFQSQLGQCQFKLPLIVHMLAK